jgi:hypothetical protein
MTDRFQNGDTATVCDATVCQKYVVKLGGTFFWFPLGTTFRDNQGTYKNGGGSYYKVSYGAGGIGSEYRVVVHGHWETWDYYSDGRYIGSDPWQYVVDSIEVFYVGSSNRRLIE